MRTITITGVGSVNKKPNVMIAAFKLTVVNSMSEQAMVESTKN